MLLVNVLNEFAQGYVFNDVIVLLDSVFAIAGAVVVLQAEGSLIDACLIGGSGRNPLFVSERDIDLDVLDLEVEVISIVFNAIAEVILSGYVSEGFNPFFYVFCLFLENLSALIVGDVVSLFSRGLNFPALFVRGNSIVAIYVGFCELLALALRPVSLAVRIFANLVNSVLISILLSPVCLDQVAGAIDAQSASVGSIFGVIGLFVNLSAVLFFEAAVSAIQVQVYFLLIRSYIDCIRS